MFPEVDELFILGIFWACPVPFLIVQQKLFEIFEETNVKITKIC